MEFRMKSLNITGRVLVGTLVALGSFLFFQKKVEAQELVQELSGRITAEQGPLRAQADNSKEGVQREKEKILKILEHTGEFNCSLLNDGSGRCLLLKNNANPTVIELPSSLELVGLSSNRYRVYFWSKKILYEISIYNLVDAAKKYDRQWISDGIKKVSGRHLLTLDGRVRRLTISRYDSGKPPFLIETNKKVIDISQSDYIDFYGSYHERDLYLTTEDGKKYLSNRNEFREIK